MADAPSPLRVRSGDVTIAVQQHSPPGPGRPTVVLVHGYPDQHDVWDALVAHLPLDDWHVVTYDVRGAGASDAPDRRADYRTDRLVDDLVAVLDEVLDEDGAVHLVGHDWGSVQLWDAVAAEADDVRLTGRIASFTSISGPSLDHAGWVVRHPGGRRQAVLAQQLHSSYIGLFCLPVVPELVWRLGHRRLADGLAKREGLPRGHWGDELAANAVHGLELYRANVLRRAAAPRPLYTEVPVLVVHPRRDPFLREVLTEDLDRACSDVRVEVVEGGHWVAVTDPDLVAPLVVEHVEAHRTHR
jgi:pimeloyl-ACP methyl ester carboxylesterase